VLLQIWPARHDVTRKVPTSGSVKRARRRVACGTGKGLHCARSTAAGIFGSVARGDAVETSDVDLLVAPGPDSTYGIDAPAHEVGPGERSAQIIHLGRAPAACFQRPSRRQSGGWRRRYPLRVRTTKRSSAGSEDLAVQV
jgi:hypothetical protein